MFGLRNTMVSISSLLNSAGGKKVLLLSPWANFRPLFFSQLSDLIEQGLIYYITPSRIEIFKDLAVDTVSEICRIYPDFGSKVMATTETSTDAELGKALAQDLNELNKPLVLLLDDIRPSTFQNDTSGLISLVQSLGDQVKLVFSSQLSSYQPWHQWIENGTAVVLNLKRHRGELTFTPQNTPKSQLEVFGFGSGVAYINGLEVIQWEGMLPRTLFFYLIDNPLASRDDIFRDFWPQPKIAIKDATDIFHVTKHKVSEVLNRRLGTPNAIELTSYKQGVYIPSDRLVRHYDVALFTDLLQRAANIDNESEREMLLQRAVGLYTAPFLTALDAQWVISRRQELETMYSDALIELGHISSRRGESETALARFQEALTYRPEREDVYRSVISILAQTGERNQALERLSELKKTVYAPLGMSIPPETQKVLKEYGLTD